VNAECIDSNGRVFDTEGLEDLIADYITFQCGIRKLVPRGIIKTYLPGVASAFDWWRLKSATPFRQALLSREVKIVAAGFTRQYDKKNSKASKIRLPYCMDLALKSREAMRVRKAFKSAGPNMEGILRKRIFVGQVMGISFMLRKSEYIYSASNTAIELTKDHATFFDYSDNPIPYDQVGRIKAKVVALNIEFAKPDASGFGRRGRHIRQDSNPTACPVCVMENWIMEVRDKFGAKKESGFFDIPGYGTLTVDDMQRVMQWTIDDSMPPGQLPKRVTLHSLRYGGASMLAAAGYPHYIIAIYGGWSPNSKALRIYTRPSEGMTELVSAHMAKMATTEASKFFMNDAFVIAKATANRRKK
jgi:hypothetical protein